MTVGVAAEAVGRIPVDHHQNAEAGRGGCLGADVQRRVRVLPQVEFRRVDDVDLVLVGADAQVRGDVVVHDDADAVGQDAADALAVAGGVVLSAGLDRVAGLTDERPRRADLRLHPRPAARVHDRVHVADALVEHDRLEVGLPVEDLRVQLGGGGAGIGVGDRLGDVGQTGGGIVDQLRVQRSVVAAHQVVERDVLGAGAAVDGLTAEGLLTGHGEHGLGEQRVIDVRLGHGRVL